MGSTADDLWALAARMAGAAGKQMVVGVKSAETVAYALRAYADLISRPSYDEIGPFRVDVWDETGIVETMAKCSNLHVAGAAFEQAAKERTRYEVILRSGIRMIARQAPCERLKQPV